MLGNKGKNRLYLIDYSINVMTIILDNVNMHEITVEIIFSGQYIVVEIYSKCYYVA